MIGQMLFAQGLILIPAFLSHHQHRAYEQLNVKHEPLQLIQPQFETPLPALQPAVSGCAWGIPLQNPTICPSLASWAPPRRPCPMRLSVCHLCHSSWRLLSLPLVRHRDQKYWHPTGTSHWCSSQLRNQGHGPFWFLNVLHLVGLEGTSENSGQTRGKVCAAVS